MSMEVIRSAVPDKLIHNALRLLHTDIIQRGVDARQFGEWLWSRHWFPHLRFEDDIFALQFELPISWRNGLLCEPQILLQFPHVGESEPDISFHVDQEPPWAEGRRYSSIIGIALSDWTCDNGGLVALIDGEPVPIELSAGDAVMMNPDLPHSGGVNRTGAIRYGVYFRYLMLEKPA